MEKELIGPTATIAAAILSKVEHLHGEFTQTVIASAFEDAYQALKAGIQLVDAAESRAAGKAPLQDLNKIQEDWDAAGRP